MATSRHAWFPAACAATLMGMSVSAVSAEEGIADDVYRYQDLRIGVSLIKSPRIHQQNPDSAEGTWSKGGSSYGTRVGLTYLRGSLEPDSQVGSVWGAQLSISTYDVGPDPYTQTNLIQPMWDWYYGWQYAVVETAGLRGFGELLPFVGGGLSHMTLEDKARIGWAVETGVRAGAYLTERRWQLGVTTTYRLEYGKVIYTLDDKKRILDITADGFSFGVEGGYRF